MNTPANSVQQNYDLLIIGGGINGAGIASAAAARGLSVLLCEQNDLASATSSASTKLIHGGLRYLEHYEFKLVREALAEREVLLKKAPHLVWPQEFILPHSSQLRPAWLIRCGLFLYDHLSPRSQIPASRKLKLENDAICKHHYKTGFSYYDCSVDDSRLVISNAMDANANGATILTQTECMKAAPFGQGWEIKLNNKLSGKSFFVRGKCLINATGPWAQSFFESCLPVDSPRKIQLIKGSHILVPRIYQGEHAYILQNPDRRIVFVIPYLEYFSLIGTTDTVFNGDVSKVSISQNEILYLLNSVNRYFNKPLKPSDVFSCFAGVRPLCDDESTNPSAVTRDYTLVMQEINGQPLLSVFGGKITTYRRLGEKVLDKIQPHFPHLATAPPKTKALPGGNFDACEWPTLLAQLSQKAPFLQDTTRTRLARCYGTLSLELLDNIHNVSDLGTHFGAGLYQKEVEYLVENEWAKYVDDVLWRRTKLGYFFSDAEKNKLKNFLSSDIAFNAPL